MLITPIRATGPPERHCVRNWSNRFLKSYSALSNVSIGPGSVTARTESEADMASISDVASRAGVSTATGCRALNGKSTVDPGLVARVVEAAQELGYQPNGPARNLRRQETAVLALIISDVENPFFTSSARGVEDVAHTVGYSVVLCNADESEDKERRYVDVAIQERVAGVIISPPSPATTVDPLLA